MPFLDLEDVRLNVVDLPASARAPADATPIVMVHGLAASSAFWYSAGANVLTRFAPVTLYDLRGHGRSSMPDTGYGVGSMTRDLLGLLDARGMDRVDLVAHSFGGMIALYFTLLHPERVRGLVLADVRVRAIQPDLRLPRKAIPERFARLLQEAGLEPDAMHEEAGIGYLEQIARLQVYAPDQAETILSELYGQSFKFFGKKSAARWIALLEKASLVADISREETFGKDDLRKLEQPMLILVGAKSSALPSCKGLAQVCPKTFYREIPNAGHFFPVSRPRAFLRPTARFLRWVAGRGREAVYPTDVPS